jgi:hypothetical protein
MVVQGTTGEVVGTAGVTVAGTPVASTPLETAEGTMDGATVGMSDDAWVLGHPGCADTREVGEGGLNFRLGGTPGLDAGDDLVGEVAVRAEAGGVAV